MQSADYGDLAETYGSKTLAWKIRKALVEGLSACYPDGERGRHYRLVTEYSANKPQRGIYLKQFFDESRRQRDRPQFLNDVLADFNPSYGRWEVDRFSSRDIAQLVREGKSHGEEKDGVVVESDATTAEGIIDELTSTQRRQIIIADVPLGGDLNVKKLKAPHKVVLLNGPAAIKRFAEGRFDLPENFKGITDEVYDQLMGHRFSFPAAFYNAFGLVHNQIGFAVRRPDGNYTFVFLRDIIKGTELYYEVRAYRPRLIDPRSPGLVEHGKIEKGGFKYHGENRFRVPRKGPQRGRRYDYVKTRYLPNVPRSRDMWLEWFNTEMICDCGYALNFRNAERRRSRKKPEYTQIADDHSRFVLLLLADKFRKRQDMSQHMVYPTKLGIDIMDAIRYRLHNRQGNGWVPANMLLMAAAKKYGHEKLFQSEPPKEHEVLRPLYTGIEVRN